MPVSRTEKATTALAALRISWSGFQPSVASFADRDTEPALGELEGVGEQVPEHLLQPLAVGLQRRRERRVHVDLEVEPLGVRHLAEGALDVLPELGERHVVTSTAIVPDSILDRSRMSLIRESRSEPEVWIVWANSTCLVVRFPSAFSVSISERISRLLSGVRSSCDMLARNSVLYLEVRASCSAFSSSACLACSISWFFRSTSVFWLASSWAFSSSSSLVCCSSSCCFLSSSSDSCSERVCCSSRVLVSVSSSCWLCSSRSATATASAAPRSACWPRSC